MLLEYKPGDLVACYLTNTSVFEELLEWGIVLEVSSTLKDVLVLNNSGLSNWYPARRWRKLPQKPQKEMELTLA
jgi:hypothetical protein